MTRSRRSARPLVAYLIVPCVALLLAAAPAAAAGWGKPFQFQKPGTLDAIAPQLTFAPGGASTAAFGTLQVDVPGTAQAQYAQRTAGGRVGPVRAVSGARRILAMSYDGPQLELLAGTSGPCRTAAARWRRSASAPAASHSVRAGSSPT